ncbi:MAG: hypothetical protein ABIL42_02325, partial [candidate division WOR-3 bacterium]
MIAAELEKVLDDIKRFVPETLGVIVASDEGLPIAHVISKALSIQDSIVIAGLLSSATAMVQNVLNEFEYIIENFPEVMDIGLEDDTFTANIRRVREICLLLIKRGLNKKIKWWANVRLNLDLETM